MFVVNAGHEIRKLHRSDMCYRYDGALDKFVNSILQTYRPHGTKYEDYFTHLGTEQTPSASVSRRPSPSSSRYER